MDNGVTFGTNGDVWFCSHDYFKYIKSRPKPVINHHPIPLMGHPMPLLGPPIPLMGHPIPLLGPPMPLLGHPMPLLGHPIPPMGRHINGPFIMFP